MGHCTFCFLKVSQSKEYCPSCGNSNISKSSGESKTYHLTRYLEAFKQGDANAELSDYGLEIAHWNMPFRFEVGIKMKFLKTLGLLSREVYVFVFGIILGGILLYSFPLISSIVASIFAICVILLNHLTGLSEALKFTKPHTAESYTIRHNTANAYGGVGREDFILEDHDFELIKIYYENNHMIAVCFGCDLKWLVKLESYTNGASLEIFIYLFAAKYKKRIEVIKDEEEVKRIKAFDPLLALLEGD